MKIYNWNPRRYRVPGPVGRLVSLGPRINNFGDLLGPLIVRKILRNRALKERTVSQQKLLSVGSVLHFAKTGDHVWGTGRNAKVEDRDHHFESLNIHAVRGPRTASFLRDRGHNVPDVQGDPALLLPNLFPQLMDLAAVKVRGIAVVPNFNDQSFDSGSFTAIDPREPLIKVVSDIAQSEFVVGSSLHSIVVAEALGVPARLVRSSSEPLFKYLDYFEGTGRYCETFANSVEEAILLGPHSAMEFAPDKLLNSFPAHLWKKAKEIDT